MSESPALPEQPTPPPSAPPARRKWRRRLKWVGGTSLVLLLIMAATMGGAEYYTAKPEFCGSCHIMDPYYESWSKDPHSAAEVDAACVDCHYAPGEKYTFMAKFKGLSQLASYFSGRAGAGRPKAHVNDASCLTSGCHGDYEFMDKEIQLGNVTFVHARHLDPNGKIAVENRRKMEELHARLVSTIGRQRIAILENLARPVEHANERNKRLSAWIAQESLADSAGDVLAYAEMLHTEVRLAQLEGMKCASCHQFDSSLNNHFSLAATTCHTCHFINQPFNTNTGRCLSCHEPPAGDVPIHGAEPPAPEAPATAPAPVVLMNHKMILENNVSCISCHSDLIHGDGHVTRRDCQNCHDQERYLKDFDNLTTEVVKDYHRVHAAGQRARCNDCHQMIEHKLLPLHQIHDAVALLSPVRQDCQHCHPNHHREQVEMLLGRGGFVEGVAEVPNPMAGSRANCRACHTAEGADPKQEAVITGTLESCRGCHGQEYVELFHQWQNAIAARLNEAQSLLATIEQQLAAATRPATAPADLNTVEVSALVSRARENIRLVSTANGIHNKNYAMALLDQAIHDLEDAGRKLAR